MDPSEAYDAFICYRRSGGAQTARFIHSSLIKAGYRVFLDVDNLSDGHFDDKLLDTISCTKNFIVILSESAFARSYDESDWFYREINHALSKDRRVIPIMMPGFKFENLDACPNRLQEIKRHNSVEYSHTYFPATLNKIIGFLGSPEQELEMVLKIPPISGAVGVPSAEGNPYFNRSMIRFPGDFFGRQREVARIMSRLDAPHPQSVSVVGERMIGKSSLLNYCCLGEIRQKHLSHSKETAFGYLDLQGIAGQSPKSFFEECQRSLLSDSAHVFAGHQELVSSHEEFSGLVEQVVTMGNRIVLLLDEFEIVTQNGQFDAAFFSFLRALANRFPFAMISSSSVELMTVCSSKDIADGPFFNIFTNLPLRPFLHEEALELISAPSANADLPLEPFAEDLLALSGYHPLFVQIGCAAAFELITKEGLLDMEKVCATFMEEALPHYEFLWENLDDQAVDVLSRVAWNQVPDPMAMHVVRDLQLRGYLKVADGGTQIASKGLHLFIQGKNTNQPSGNWIKRFFLGN